MTHHRHRPFAGRLIDQLRTFGQHPGRIFAEQPDQLLAVLAQRIRSTQRPFANEILILGNDPVHPQVHRGDRTVGVLPHDHISLFRSQHMHGLGPVGGDIEDPAGRHHGLPQGPASVGVDADLKTQFTAETDAADLRRYARGLARAETHKRQSICRQVYAGADLLQHLAAVRSGNAHHRPVIGDRGEIDL